MYIHFSCIQVHIKFIQIIKDKGKPFEKMGRKASDLR